STKGHLHGSETFHRPLSSLGRLFGGLKFFAAPLFARLAHFTPKFTVGLSRRCAGSCHSVSGIAWQQVLLHHAKLPIISGAVKDENSIVHLVWPGLDVNA